MSETTRNNGYVRAFATLLVALLVALGVGLVAMPQTAEAISQDEAVAWTMGQEGEYLDYDGVYGNQCVDLIKYYYEFFGVAEYAKGNGSAYTSNSLPPGWTRIANTPDFIPQPGDIAVWGTSLSSAGHVAIILSASSSSFVSMDQNWPRGSVCRQVTHTYNKFWGVIRPQYSNPTPTFQYAVDSPSQNSSFGGNLVATGWAHIGGTPPTRVVYQINGGAERAAALYNRGDVPNGSAFRAEIPNSSFNAGWNWIAFAADFADGHREYMERREIFNTHSANGPTVTDVQVTDISMSGYTVSCHIEAPNGIKSVSMPTWSHYNWQDDIRWEEVAASGTVANVTFRVKTSDHHVDLGYYSTHIYVTDNMGFQCVSGLASDILVPKAVARSADSTYYLIDASVLAGTWDEARSYVDSSWQGRHGGHLAVITSSGENDVVASLAKKGERFSYWLGATDRDSEGSFAWVTDEPFGYANWGPRDPNGGSDENWLALIGGDGTWQDLPQSGSGGNKANMGFIVEVPERNSEVAVENVEISNLGVDGFTVTAHIAGGDAISKVQVSAWTDENGQDDVVAGVVSPDEDGMVSYRVSVSDHGGNHGLYRCAVYAWDASNQLSTGFAKGAGRSIIVPTVALDYRGSAYYLCDVSSTWDEANAYASSFMEGTSLSGSDAHLVTIESPDEQDAVAGLLEKGSKWAYWLGLTDVASEGTFRWVTGDALDYSNWASENPNGGTEENWVAMVSSGEWHDYPTTGIGGTRVNNGFIVEMKSTRVEKPVAYTGLVYDGSAKFCAPVTDGYTLSGDVSAVDAGEYVAVAKLDDGYTWSDGTTDDVRLEWSIAKAEGNAVDVDDATFTYDGTDHEIDEPEAAKDGSTVLYSFDGKNWTTAMPQFLSAGEYTLYVKVVNPNYEDSEPAEVSVEVEKAKLIATYVSETVAYGEQPKGKVVVTGFAETDVPGNELIDDEGESEWMLPGYVEPTVALPATLEANKSYQLTPQGGEALDYEFVYVAGTLSVGVDKSALQTAIAQAQEALEKYAVSADGSDVPSDEKWVTQSQVDSLNSSITMAQALLASDDVALVSNGASMLQVATASFEASAKPGTKPAEMAKPTIAANQSFTYDGEAHDVALPDDSRLAVTGTASATDAGTYHAYVSPAAGYAWTGGATDSIDVTWRIVQAVPSLVPDSESALLETGDSIVINVSYDGDGAVSAASADPSVATASYANGKLTVKAVSAGQTRVTLTAAAGSNYKKADDVAVSVGVQAKVTRVVKPSAEGFTYDGASHSGVAEGDGYVLYGVQRAVEAGSYQTIAMLKDGCSWADGSSNALVLDWTIQKAKPTLAMDSLSAVLDGVAASEISLQYDGDGAVLAVSSNPGVVDASVSGEKLVLKGKASGAASVTVLADEGKNYLASEVLTVAVTVQHVHVADEPVRQNEVAATCESAGGYDLVTRCAECGEVLSSAHVVVAALGHDWNEGTVTTEPTCTEPGTRTFTCTRDSAHTRAEVVPALGHDYVAEVVAPTAEAGGYTRHTCSRCGDSYVTDETDPIGPAIDPTAADPVKDGPAAWTRFAGENAYGTMAKIVQAGWPDGSGAVVVATFDGYWDALTASGLAGFLGCPVLMTDTSSLSATARAEIERLGATTAFVAGGTAAVSAGVEAELADMGLAVVRAAGDNAAGTARDAYEKSKAYGEWGKTAIVATADGYWDALAMSPYSYCAHAPIFLAQEPAGGAMRLDADTLAAIEAGGFDTVLVAGGEAAVSPDVESQLPGLAVERLAGDTAVETSRAIAAYCANNGMSKAKVAVATTDGYWDALTGAALCGKTRTPMVLASPANASAAADGFVSSESSTIAVGYIFGGEAAVAPASEAALREATR